MIGKSGLEDFQKERVKHGLEDPCPINYNSGGKTQT